MFSRILKHIPLISVGLFLLSYIHFYSYYATFNINIINYTTASDLVYLFLPNIAWSALLSLIIIIVLDHKIFLSSHQTILPISKGGLSFGCLRLIIFIIVMLLGGSLLYYKYKSSIGSFFAALGMSAVFFSIILTTLSIIWKGQSNKYYITIAIIITVAFNSWASGVAKAKGAASGDFRTRMSMKHDGHIFSTNDTTFYIGRTQSTLFFVRKNPIGLRESNLLDYKGDSVFNFLTIIFNRENVDSIVVESMFSIPTDDDFYSE